MLFAILLFLLQGAPASIEGVVVRAGTSTPVARARVSIGAAQALTDASGRFSFKNLRPGSYRVSAAHNAYLPAQYGERTRGAQGKEITLGSGQDVKDIVVSLTPKSAISGRLYDKYGDPVTNANVQALKYTYQDGRRILIVVDTARTNDLGEYRLFWLTPGPYIISAIPPESLFAVEGGVIGISAGPVRFDGNVVAPAPSPETHLAVYYPGTTDPAGASLIDLPPGINYTGVDLPVIDARAVGVRGQIVNSLTGQPAIGAAINLVPRRGTVATGSTARAVVGAGGVFEFRHMAPGSYDLVASAPGTGGGARLAAHAPVELGGSDVDGVSLVLQPQLTINGRITLENSQPDETGTSVRGARVELRREPFTPELLILLPGVAADGTFTLSGVTPGEYRLKVSLGGFKSYVKTARFGGIDALNPPFRIDVADGRLEIVVGRNPGSLDGAVLDDALKPFPDATVVLVPEPPRRQRFDLYYAAGSDASGRVHFDGLAPGDYKIFAWDDVPADAWQDPDFLRTYENLGKPVRVSEGSQESIDLKLIPRS